jgi:hypothetical protein
MRTPEERAELERILEENQPLTPAVLKRLKAEGKITHQEYRLFTDGSDEPSNFGFEDDDG